MALINCRECGAKISSLSKVCPTCGCPTNISLNKSYLPSKTFTLSFKNISAGNIDLGFFDFIKKLSAKIMCYDNAQIALPYFSVSNFKCPDYISRLLGYIFSDIKAFKRMLQNGSNVIYSIKNQSFTRVNNIDPQEDFDNLWDAVCQQKYVAFDCANSNDNYAFKFFITNENKLKMEIFISNKPIASSPFFVAEEKELFEYANELSDYLENCINQYK